MTTVFKTFLKLKYLQKDLVTQLFQQMITLELYLKWIESQSIIIQNQYVKVLMIEKIKRGEQHIKNKTEVTIIGGGFTGLAAAYELVKNGITITLMKLNTVKQRGNPSNWLSQPKNIIMPRKLNVQRKSRRRYTNADKISIIYKCGAELRLGL